MASSKQTPEYRKIQDNYAKICSTLTNHVLPGDFGNKLFQANLIGENLKRAANREIVDEAVRINDLLAAVHNQIELKSANFYKFIKILEEYGQLEELLKLLKLKTAQQQEKRSEETSGKTPLPASEIRLLAGEMRLPAGEMRLPAGEMQLSEKDLGVLTDILKGAVTKWKVIGLALGFLDAELTAIERKPLLIPEGDTGYFREMLSRWLKWTPSNHPWPTLEALARALNRAGEERLAYYLKGQYLAKNGNTATASVTPSTMHPSSKRKYVTPYRASSRDGLRSTTTTSPDLETQEKSKLHEATLKNSYCPSWKWCGGICIAVGVVAVLIAVTVKLYPDALNNLTADCHRISKNQELGRAVASIGDWETLCENLGAPEPVLKQLRFDGIPNEMKRRRCLEAYLNTGKACWETVVQVVADDPFYNKKLAKKVADEHGVDYSSIVKDEL